MPIVEYIFLVLCIKHPWLKIIVASLRLNRPVGKVMDSYVESLFLKDSCDGSGLNASENSKDSHPLGLRGCFE